MSAELEAMGAVIREWRNVPGKFEWDNFKIEPDKWQMEEIKAFCDPAQQRIAMRACVGPGKTAVLAWNGLKFLSCYGAPGEHPKGAAVSITGDNLHDNLWPEINKWMKRSKFLDKMLVWTKKRIFARSHPETWFLSARSWSKSASPEEQGRTLSGLHSKYVLVLVDESGEIPPPVIKAGEQALSTRPVFGKLVQAGNPTSHKGILYSAAGEHAHLWKNIRITADPEDPDHSPRCDLTWAMEQIKTYGRQDPWVMSNILGQFPPTSINALLGPEEIELAMRRSLREEAYAFSQKRLGIDVARFGDDRTVLYPRQGLQVFNPVEMRGADGPQVAARVAVAKSRFHQEIEFLDATGGWGSSVEDALKLAGINVFNVNFAGKADEPRYFNKRAEMIWRMCEGIKGGWALPPRPGLKRELLALQYWFDKGKLRIIEKDQIKKILKCSPDESDALATTCAIADLPASTMPDGTPMRGAGNVGKAITEAPEDGE